MDEELKESIARLSKNVGKLKLELAKHGMKIREDNESIFNSLDYVSSKINNLKPSDFSGPSTSKLQTLKNEAMDLGNRLNEYRSDLYKQGKEKLYEIIRDEILPYFAMVITTLSNIIEDIK